MKNSDYWKERFRQLEESQNRKGAEAFAEIEQQYRQAQREIEWQINTWYQRLADNNEISLAEARKLLAKDELKEFKWDVNEYIRRGKENAKNERWMKELENASAKFHISRLEALKIRTQQSLEVMYAKQMGTVTGTMQEVFKSGYYHTAFELQKGMEIGWDIASIDQRRLEKVICKPWAPDGKNFSERIWNNRERLVSEIHKEITQDVMLGRDPQKAIDAIAKKMNTSKVNAGRLVMTEEAYFASAAQKECFNALDVEKYEIVATLDSHTSDICQSLDGQVFLMQDYEPGTTAPPFHVNCRTVTVPYYDDDFGSVGERAARDENGKTYYVPADMTYKEWKRSFVDGDKSGLQEINPDGTMGTAKGKEDVKVHSVGKIDKEIYKCITPYIVTDEVIITDERIAHIKERHPNDYERFYSYISDIISNPDYIIEANKPDTAIVLKQITDNNEKFQMVLRIITPTDNKEYKNSIITFLKVSERTWKKYLRNKKILYKRE